MDRLNKALELDKLAKAKTTKPNVKAVGFVGMKTSSGLVEEEFLQTLRWPQAGRVYQEMASNDAVIGACLYLIEVLIRRAKWYVKPATDDPGDQENAVFLEQCMNDMSHTWDEFICEALSMLTYGFSFHELTYKVRRGPLEKDPKFRSKYSDGKFGWQAMSVRSQASMREWVIDEATGDILEFVQDPGQVGGNGQVANIPIEGNLLFRTRSQRNNPEGWSILRRVYRCFDRDTELLTKAGWKNITQITCDDELATLNSSAYIEYQRPSVMNTYAYTGDMIRVATKSLDMLVTPNHRMLVKKKGATRYGFVEAAELCTQHKMLRGAHWVGSEIATYTVPTHGVHMAVAKTIDIYTWAAFLGLLLSDGFTCTVSKTGQQFLGITQKRGGKADAIRELLEKMPYHVYEHDMENDGVSFEIYDKALCLDVAPFCGKARNKRIPQIIKDASSDIISQFIAWYWFGDGTISGATNDYAGTMTISSVSEGLIDDLHELALKAGYAGNKWSREQTDSFGASRLYFISFSEILENMATNITTEAYDGIVYCPTTANGVVYARRNGKACWSGNSWYFKKYIEELEGIGVERNLAGIPVLQPAEDVDLFNPDNEDMKEMLAWSQALVDGLRQDRNHGVVIPAGWELKLLGAEGSSKAMDTDAIIRRHETRMAMAMLADIVVMGSDRTGSFALGEVKQNIFISSLQAIIGTICSTINASAVPRLFALNGMELEAYPQIAAKDLDTPAVNEVALLLRAMGIDISKNKELYNFMMETIQGPTVTEADFATKVQAINNKAGMPQDETDNAAKQSDQSYT